MSETPTTEIITMPESVPPSPTSVVNDINRKISRKTKTRGGLLFPLKLQSMLNVNSSTKAEERGSTRRESIVSWFPHGKAFKVYNVPAFVSDVLPLFFKQTKFKSFQRQLNLWGFLRIQDGPEKGAYYHKDFLRDKPDLVCLLKRQKAGRKSPSVPTLPASMNTTTNTNTIKTDTTSESTSIPMESTVTTAQQQQQKQQQQHHQQQQQQRQGYKEVIPIPMIIASSSNDRNPFASTSRQVSVGSLENRESDGIFEKWNLPSSLFTIPNENNKNTKESTAASRMIPMKKSMKIEQQEIIPMASPSSSCVSSNRSVSTSTPTPTESTTSSDEESSQRIVHKFDSKSFDPFDLAEFEGFTFYHLEEQHQRCCEEEFDIKFKFTTPTTGEVEEDEYNEVRQQTHALLNKLEQQQGYTQGQEHYDDYGIPEMTFDTSDM